MVVGGRGRLIGYFSLLAGSSKEEDTLVSEAANTDSSPEDGMWCSRLVEEGRDPQSGT